MSLGNARYLLTWTVAKIIVDLGEGTNIRVEVVKRPMVSGRQWQGMTVA